MISAQWEIQIIAMVVAVSCALPGVFLVLRKMAMMSDAISHSILIGIVLAFFITHNLSSPFLVIAAALSGVLTVGLVELLNRTKLVKEDAAIGLVFPLLFSLGVILISRYAGDIHLDSDAVLLGELAFAPFDRFSITGYDIGPKSLYVMSGIMLINFLFILLFYKELKLVSFDAGLAATLGFSPTIIHYSLMSLVSLTAVGAFNAVGSILVVALMIGPPVTAYLITDRLSRILLLSALIGIISAIVGYWTAHFLDASIAGCMASIVGVFFFLTFLFIPQRGLVAIARKHSRQKIQFAIEMLLVHILNHEGLPEEEKECRYSHLNDHLYWNEYFVKRIVRQGERKDLVTRDKDILRLTPQGRNAAVKSMEK